MGDLRCHDYFLYSFSDLVFSTIINYQIYFLYRMKLHRLLIPVKNFRSVHRIFSASVLHVGLINNLSFAVTVVATRHRIAPLVIPCRKNPSPLVCNHTYDIAPALSVTGI